MKITKIKLKIIRSPWYQQLFDELGEDPPFQEVLAQRIGIDRRNLSPVLNERIINKSIQEKIAEEVGIPVAKLFGDTAWFRAGLKKAKEIHDRQLAACSN